MKFNAHVMVQGIHLAGTGAELLFVSSSSLGSDHEGLLFEAVGESLHGKVITEGYQDGGSATTYILEGGGSLGSRVLNLRCVMVLCECQLNRRRYELIVIL
jgi:hypothetical protein